MPFRIRKKFTFEAAHRLCSSETIECQRIHGHSYTVEVFLVSEHAQEHDMVLDFKCVSEVVKPMIAKWDHMMLQRQEEAETEETIQTAVRAGIVYLPGNPTAELMAFILYDQIKDAGLPVEKVRVHETATGWAEYWR